ncbi:uncharacterized protein LOC141978145 isoform X2 [Natator depressus]|uniref:uncharacterized protein LOC141978145 isoform X2 n=1 Tax=Natator depressus TaxID=27790 RepID=UPI003EC08255
MGWGYPESAQLRAAAASASRAHAIKTEQTAAASSLTQQFKKPRLRGSSGPAPVQQTAFGTETDSHQSLNLPTVGQNPSVDPVPISQRGGFATAMEERLPSAAALRVQTQPYSDTPGSTLHQFAVELLQCPDNIPGWTTLVSAHPRCQVERAPTAIWLMR